MTVVAVVGVVAAAVTAWRAVPQLVRLRATRDGLGGVSVGAAATNAAAYVPLIAHGAATGRWGLVVANGFAAAVYVLISVSGLRCGAPRSDLRWPAAFVAATATTAAVGGRPWALAATLVLFGVPQVSEAARAPTVAALSPATLALAVVEVGLWLAVASAAGDVLLAAYMAVSLAIHVATLAIWRARSRAAPTVGAVPAAA